MSFYWSMLHCGGDCFYVGYTDNLEARLWQHKNGITPGFTGDHLPVQLVWCEPFPTRDEAIAAEHRVKGWSRAKKMALIPGDWHEISKLANKKDTPSTGSGKAVAA